MGSARRSSSKTPPGLDDTNMYRCMHGAGPLMWNDLLADSAFQFFKYQASVSHHHSDSYDLTAAAAQGGPAGRRGPRLRNAIHIR